MEPDRPKTSITKAERNCEMDLRGTGGRGGGVDKDQGCQIRGAKNTRTEEVSHYVLYYFFLLNTSRKIFKCDFLVNLYLHNSLIFCTPSTHSGSDTLFSCSLGLHTPFIQKRVRRSRSPETKDDTSLFCLGT